MYFEPPSANTHDDVSALHLARDLRATASAAPAETPAKTPSRSSSLRSAITASPLETSTLRSSWEMSRIGGV